MVGMGIGGGFGELASSAADNWRLCIYDTVRFLPSQEWSVVGMGIVGGFGELVSSAADIWRLCIYDTVRFLPSQEWSVGERESIGEYGIVAACRHCYRRIP